MFDWLLNLPPVAQALIRALIWVLLVFGPVPIFIWWERRLLAWAQDRIGPNRTGTITFSKRNRRLPEFLRGRKFRILYGIPQIIADGAKSFFKEDMAPSSIDRFIYFLAPALALFPPFAIGATIPFAAWRAVTPVADVNIGVLYILAISSLGVYGVVLAGYGSNNKYSLMGGLRASAQLISYELAMGMSLAAIALASGSLKLTDILAAQEGPLWGVVPALQNWYLFTPFGLVAAAVFLVCMVAETNRAPFDLPECESELVAGYNTEYSTKKWVLFMMGEYVAMFVFSCVLSTVFFGGYHLLPVRWEYLAETFPGAAGVFRFLAGVNYWIAPLVFFAKAFFFITVYIWLRATLPRLRYDQLMGLGWKSLLPLATANFVVVALWLVSTRLLEERLDSALVGTLLGWAALLLAALLLYGVYRVIRGGGRGETDRLEPRGIRLLDIEPERRAVAVVDPGAA